jgi:ABC-2 type transport system permease protein
MSGRRVGALLAKEFADLRRNAALWLPVVMSLVALALPFVLLIGLPRWLGVPGPEADADLRRAAEAASRFESSGLRLVSPLAAIQGFMFQQFLLFLVILPAGGALTLAAHGIIGEKQSRTLEPLLTTPLSTMELLTTKLLAAAIPAIGLGWASLVLYVAGIWWLAEPGVLRVVLTPRTLVIACLLGPLAAVAALELALIVSSRVNDPRSAQQVGLVVILPMVGVLIAQFAGLFFLTTAVALLLAGGMTALIAMLMAVAVQIFDRETILTRWK